MASIIFHVKYSLFFDSKEEAYNEETYLVDNKWVLNEDTYNLCVGEREA